MSKNRDIANQNAKTVDNFPVSQTPAPNTIPVADSNGKLNAWVDSSGGGGGATTFIDLSDTPTSYSGNAGKIVAVKSDETGLEFKDLPTGGGISSPLTTKGDIWVYSDKDDRLPVGQDGQFLKADSSSPTGLSWDYPPAGDMQKSVYDANDNGIVDNAEKLNGYSASSTPTPNTIPIADNNGYLNGWVKQGVGSGLDADTVKGIQVLKLQNITGNGNVTIDWNNGTMVKLTLTGDTTLTFTNPSQPCHLTLEIIQDSTGGHKLTLPSGVKWPDGTAPTLPTDANNISLVALFFDGENYLGMSANSFA